MALEAQTSEFRERVEDALLRDDPIELMDVITEVALEAEPWDWAQACCVQLARRVQGDLRSNSLSPSREGC